MIHFAAHSAEVHMQIARKIFVLIAGFGLTLTALLNWKTAGASPLESKAPAMIAKASAPGQGMLTIPETTLAINSDKPMSQRVMHYEIEARYDIAKHIVDETEVLPYHNMTGQALDHFPFHLYQIAFQPKSTWIREAKIEGSRDTAYEKWDDKEYGSEEIKSLELVGQGDLTGQLQYIAPDDGNKDDKTVVDVHVPRAIAPGGYAQFKIAVQTRFTET